MSTAMLLIVSSLYFGVGVQEAFKGNWWWFVFWSSYAVANLAWIQAATK